MAGIRNDLETRLTGLEQHNPEWRSWLALVRETAALLHEHAWAAPLAEEPAAPHQPATPLLDGRQLGVDAGRVRDAVTRLAAASGHPSLAGYRSSPDDAVALVEATVRQDEVRSGALATAAGTEAGILATVGRLVAFPILVACGRQLAGSLPADWPHGYCPICGAWPVLAELIGIDRARRLRCGRCACDWQVNWLHCPYCGENDHRQLGALVPEGGPETRKIETCDSCLGYVKSVATLQPAPPIELLLCDLETVELDLVAADRGFVRPPGLGYPVDVRVAARRARSILPFG
ncbi:MAG: formate dehydrogenase accessory protein FdhE [Gemmatimonadales bacterium]